MLRLPSLEAKSCSRYSSKAKGLLTEDDEKALEEECIKMLVCDAQECTKKNPIYCCSNCRCVCYCSLECEKRHSETHKNDCPNIDVMRAEVETIGSGLVTAVEPDDETIQRVLQDRPLCGICLEEELTNPIVLQKCHHAFCLGCLNQWNEHESSLLLAGQPKQSSCPMCRQSIPDVVDAIFQNALTHLTVASLPTTNPKEREIRCASAEAELVKVLCNNSLSDQQQVQLELIWGEIVLLLKHYDTALEILQEAASNLQIMVKRQERVLDLMDRFHRLRQNPTNDHEAQEIMNERQRLLLEGSCARPADHAIVLLRIGYIQRLQQKWDAALRTYQDIWSKYVENSLLGPSQQQEIFASIAEVAFHLGCHDRAVVFGEAIVSMNRYYTWSHKYLALAHRALGNFDKARGVAAAGVIYEAPWDDFHRAQVRQWYFNTFGKTELSRNRNDH